jgi:hypothetical protein
MELNVVYLYITAFSPMRQKKTNLSSNPQWKKFAYSSECIFIILMFHSECFLFRTITFVVKLYETCLNGALSLMHSD